MFLDGTVNEMVERFTGINSALASASVESHKYHMKASIFTGTITINISTGSSDSMVASSSLRNCVTIYK